MKHLNQLHGIFRRLSSGTKFKCHHIYLKEFSQKNNQQQPVLKEFASLERFVPKTDDEYDKQHRLKPHQPVSPKLLYVSILGEPNVGKSTLTNQLLNWKVCSVSRKVHTTKYNTPAVLIEGDTQIVFLDTPGLVTPQHGRKHSLETSFVVDPENSLLQADIIAVVVDVAITKRLSTPLLKLLHKKKEKKSILILNKIDKLKSKSQLLEITRNLTTGIVDGQISSIDTREEKPKSITLTALLQDTEKKLQNTQNGITFSTEQNKTGSESLAEKNGWPLFSRVFMISALDGDGVQQLRDYFLKSAYSNPWIYHNSIVTIQNPHEIAIMTVREKLLDYLPQEIPYSVKLAIEMWEETSDGLLNILIGVTCPRKGIVKLIIGPKGKMVSRIADSAQQDLANTFRCDISLKLIIKADN